MRRLLLFFSFIFIVVGVKAQDSIKVYGYIIDTMKNFVTGGKVYINYKNGTGNAEAYVINGYYESYLPYIGNSDSIFVSYYDGCHNYSNGKQYTPGDTEVKMDTLSVECKPPLDVEIYGKVLDTLSLGVPDAPIKIISYPNIYSLTSKNDGRYEITITMKSPEDTLWIFKANDKCGHEIKDTVIIHYGPPISYNINVPCGDEPRLHVEGHILDENGNIAESACNVPVKIYFKNFGVVAWANTTCDYNSFYEIDLPIPPSPDSLFVEASYKFSEQDYKTVEKRYFNGSNYNFNVNLTTNSSATYWANVPISGKIILPDSTEVEHVKVEAYWINDTHFIVRDYTDQYGYFDISLPPTEKTLDTILLKYSDSCQTYYDTLYYDYNSQTSFNGQYVINCGVEPVPSNIEISGYVRDDKGRPVKDISVHAMVGNSKPLLSNNSEIKTNDYGYYKLTLPTPNSSPEQISVYAKDFCSTEYKNIINYSGDKFVFDSINFSVHCASIPKYVIGGLVKNSNNEPLPGVKVKVYSPYDSNKFSMSVTDAQGYYKFIIEDVIETDYFGILAIDNCENKKDTLVPFNSDKHNYTVNLSLSCAGSIPDSVLNFIGIVKDNSNNEVQYQIVGVKVIDTLENDTVERLTMTNAQGFYSISLPQPQHNVKTIVYVQDACNNYYSDTSIFDFSNFSFSHDFTISCPPNIVSEEPKLAIGFKPDWNSFTKFHFFAKPTALPDSLIDYYVWYLHFDTIATKQPILEYTFPVTDTCINVKAELLTTQGKSMLSAPIKICVINPFKYIGDSCYTDFTVTKLSNNEMLFVPYVAREAGMLPTSAVWNFGDGNYYEINPPDTLDKPVSHIYTSAGKYMVTYIINFEDTLGHQCNASWQNPVWIGSDVWYPDSCVALFYADVDSSNNLKMHFEDISYPGNSAEVEYYYWEFGDGVTSTISSPDHLYDTAGTYLVKMQIITATGCVDSVKTEVPVQLGVEPMLFFPDTVAVSKGKNGRKAYGVKFRNISKKSKDKYKWDFGDALKEEYITTYDTITHYYADTGIYDVIMQDYYTNAGVKIKIHLISATKVSYLSITLIPASETTTSIEQTYDFERLKLFPNPTDDLINLVLPERSDNLRVEIINTQGQIVKTIFASNIEKLSVNVSSLSSGTYFIRTINGNKIGIAKFIKN